MMNADSTQADFYHAMNDSAKTENVRMDSATPPAERNGVGISKGDIGSRAVNRPAIITVPSQVDGLLMGLDGLRDRSNDATFYPDLFIIRETSFSLSLGRNSIYNWDAPKNLIGKIGGNTWFAGPKNTLLFVGGFHNTTFNDGPTYQFHNLSVPGTSREICASIGSMTKFGKNSLALVLSENWASNPEKSEGVITPSAFNFTAVYASDVYFGGKKSGKFISSFRTGVEDGKWSMALFTNSLEGRDMTPTIQVGFGNNRIQVGAGMEVPLGSGWRLGGSGIYKRDSRENGSKNSFDARGFLTMSTYGVDMTAWLGNKSADYGDVKFVTKMGIEATFYLGRLLEKKRSAGESQGHSSKDEEKYVQAESGLYLPKKEEMKTKEGIFRQLCREVKAVDDAHKAGKSAYVRQGRLLVKSAR